MIALNVAGGPARRELRSGYTGAILEQAEAAAAGTAGGLAVCTAAIETASGLWGRGLAQARVEPRSVRTRALTAPLLAMIGRALCRRGEITFDMRVVAGELRLLPASSAYVIRGTGDPSSWIYTVTVDGPAGTETHWRRREAVAHLQYLTDAERPWLSRSPWSSAPLSARLLAGVERQFAGEAAGASGYILPTPDTGDRGQSDPAGNAADEENDPLTTLRRDLAAAGGKTTLAPGTASGWGAGPAAATMAEYQSRRFGLNPPDTAVELRRDVERSILAASGIPPALVSPNAAGTAMREGWRQFTVGTLEPLAVLVGDQLSVALGERVTLTPPRAADVATLARAVGSLVTAGMKVDDARSIVGL